MEITRKHVVIAGVVCLTAICISALWKSIDTTLVATVAGIIGTIIGYMYGVKKG